MDQYQGNFRGEGRNLEQWYSICSAHKEYKTGCLRCSVGHYVNVRKNKRELLFYKIFPWLYKYLVNRKE